MYNQRVTIATFIGVLAVSGAHPAMAQTELATGPFTDSQVEQGRKVYAARCSTCHLPSLAGQGDAGALVGTQFMRGWFNRTTQDLYKLIQSSMPKTDPGSLDDQSAANVTAFILRANGARSGPMMFLAAPPLRLSLIANGIAPGDFDPGAPAK